MTKEVEWADILNEEQLADLEQERHGLQEFDLIDNILLYLSIKEVKEGDLIFIVEKDSIIIEGEYLGSSGEFKYYDDIDSVNDLEFRRFLQEDFKDALISKINEILK